MALPSSNDRSKAATGGLGFWIEFVCWTTLALSPFLYWINGAAVSVDQQCGRITLMSTAAIGALVLRSWKLCRGRKSGRAKIDSVESF